MNDAIANLLRAARSASATLSHAYHQGSLTGDLAEEAHSDYQRLDAAIAALSGMSAPVGVDAEELRRALCQIGIVGNIDGHDVIRRESVLDIIDRRRAALTPAAAPRVECDGLSACNKPDCSVHASAASDEGEQP